MAYDKISSGYQYPTSDTKNELNFTFKDVDSNTLEVTIRRACDTGDTEDYVLQADTNIDFGWAVRTTSA